MTLFCKYCNLEFETKKFLIMHSFYNHPETLISKPVVCSHDFRNRRSAASCIFQICEKCDKGRVIPKFSIIQPIRTSSKTIEMFK